MREIYDIFTKQTIDVTTGIKRMGKELGIDYTGLCHVLSGDQLSFKCRYILPQNKDKIFTLVNYDTEQEYDCISAKSIFVQLNMPVVENEIKYVFELQRKRQAVASICGGIYYLKGANKQFCKFRGIKNYSAKALDGQKQNKLIRKIKNRLMSRISSALKVYNLKKNDRTENIIGCKISFLKDFLEKQFTKNMSFDNYGDWHIDHIIPVELFDIDDKEQQQKCFHYTNLRPLWATTEIARRYGEDNYIGNQNRPRNNHNNLPLDIEIWRKI